MPKRKPIRILPPRKYLRECLSYDQKTGELWWKYRPKRHFTIQRTRSIWNSKYAKKRAGNSTLFGYRRVAIDNVSYREHRVIWKIMMGIDPAESIDHVDGNPSNNEWANLRLATPLEQLWNSRFRSNNTSGYRGVKAHRGKWVAQIKRFGKYRHLGIFNTAKEAFAVYDAAARKLHGNFYRST